MAVVRPFVQGPEYVARTREATALVQKLVENRWNFDSVPAVYARNSQADVLSKELVHIFDGRRVTRVGRLVIGGVGEYFNLMGPIPSDSQIRITDSRLLKAVNAQLGGSGIQDHPDYKNLRNVQEVDFFNYGMFHTLEELVHWLLVHETGCFPSTLQHVVREFARGRMVQNYMYRANLRGKRPEAPVIMQARCMSYSFPSTVMEWMDRPLFGGLAKETMHVETLLTLSPSDASHPHLELTGEGKVEFGHQLFYARQFMGTTGKDGTRGPGVPEEAPRPR